MEVERVVLYVQVLTCTNLSFVLQHCWDISHPSNGHCTPQASY